MVAAQLSYQEVPAVVTRVSAYEWREGSRPTLLPLSLARRADRITITIDVRSRVIVLLHRSDGAYIVDGPISIASDAVDRSVDGVWRRTVTGTADTSGIAPSDIAWVAAESAARDPWPRCWWTGAAQWECLGVPLDAAGVAVVSGNGILAAPVVPAATALMRPSRWGRLIVVTDRGGAAPAALRLTAARPGEPRPQRARAVRVDTVPIADLRITVIARGVAWIAGDSSPPGAWLDVRGSHDGPVFVPLADVAGGPAVVPVRVVLDEVRSLEARVIASGQPAAETLVTTYRLVDPLPRGETRDPPPRRVFVAETVADADGIAHLDALGDADYEAVAWHPRLGRASMLLPAGTGTVTIRLQSPGIARGRVLAGGKPAAGIDIVSLPDPAAYAATQDPIDVKGGDARTGPDGRFSVALAPGGGGELRVGGGAHAVRRIPLPRAPLPLVELGDIDLARAFTVSVALDQDSSCELRAAGPIGRSGLQIVKGTRAGPGLFTIALPEEGPWQFVLLCGRDERALAPAMVNVTAGDPQIRLAIR